MRRCIYCKAVHHRLDWEVFELPEVIGIVLLEHANDAAGRGINPAEAPVEFDDIGALSEPVVDTIARCTIRSRVHPDLSPRP